MSQLAQISLDNYSRACDVSRIIGSNSIPGEKIAIELTESRSEADFAVMKERRLT